MQTQHCANAAGYVVHMKPCHHNYIEEICII